MSDKNTVLKNSAMTSVVTPIGYVINEFLNMLEEFDPDLAYVYDEQLTYETSLSKWRQDNQITEQNSEELPLFSFRRSVLRAEDEKGIGARSKQFSVSCIDGDLKKKFKVFYGAFDIDFLFFTKNMLDLERFELTYLMQSGLSKKKTILMDIPQMGNPREYNIEYGTLDEKTINIDNSYYKVLSGTFTIRGLFYAFDSESAYIKTVNAKIRDFVVSTGQPTETLGEIEINETTTILR